MRGDSVSPLLDFDDHRPALIEPAADVLDAPQACVVTFFGDAVRRLLQSGRARVLAENRWEDGPHPLLELDHAGERVALLHAGVGAPLAAGLLEETIAAGCRAFVVCGGAGVLLPELVLGHLVLVESAVRDEGTSHHYLPAGRVIDADPAAVEVCRRLLAERAVPHLVGRVWTTDAPYRETPAKIALRRGEGCVAVEMEAAALAAVARFRGVRLGQLLYGGDDLSGPVWDNRAWQSAAAVRDSLIDLAATAALRLVER